MTALPPGLHLNVSPSVYHADPAPRPSLSSTLARAILRSPAHCRHIMREPQHSAVFDFGSAVHTLVLGRGERVRVLSPEHDSYRTKAAQAERDAAYAAGEIPMLADFYAEVEAVADTVRDELAAFVCGNPFRDPARNEVVAIGEIDGVMCRTMFDSLGADGWAYDLKTTTDASEAAVKRAMESYGYHVQAAHYLDTYAAATQGQRLKGMRFVFVEKTAPHGVSVVQISESDAETTGWMVLARDQLAEARRLWAACVSADDWPGYPAEIIEIAPPPWAEARWETQRDVVRAIKPKPSEAAKAAAYAAGMPHELDGVE